MLDKKPHIDTKELASKNIYSFNNRLGYLGEQFVGTKKLEHEGWELWVKVWHKVKSAMKLMTKYCKQDVVVLENIFIILKPFATNLPNQNLWINHEDEDAPKRVCPSCGSLRLKSHGWVHAKTLTYRRMRCRDCQSFSRVDVRGNKPRSI